MQAQRGIAVATTDLTILHGSSLTEHGFRLSEMSPRDVDHRRLEVSEREIRVERESVRGGSQALASPRRVSEPEKMPPVRRSSATARRADLHRFFRFPSADQHERESCMRFGKSGVKYHGSPSVTNRVIQ